MVAINTGFADFIGSKQTTQQTQRAKNQVTTTAFAGAVTFGANINTGRSATWTAGWLAMKQCHNLKFLMVFIDNVKLINFR